MRKTTKSGGVKGGDGADICRDLVLGMILSFFTQVHNTYTFTSTASCPGVHAEAPVYAHKGSGVCTPWNTIG